jgi:hypothetical protein
MNFNQGMRRTAIFAGVLGAIAGGAYSYRVLRKVPPERYQHKAFLRLAGSEIVQWNRKLLQSEKAAGWSLSWPLTSDVDMTIEEIQPTLSGGVVDLCALAMRYGGTCEPQGGHTVKFSDHQPLRTLQLRNLAES